MAGRRANNPDGPRVVIVGAGFAGLAAVSRLAGRGMQVLLVDRNPYSTFQPLLYQVATAGLAPSDVAYSLRGFVHKRGARFTLGDLAHIDQAERVATLADGTRLPYDYLILGTGVAASHFGVRGAVEYTYGLYNRHDAVALRDRLLDALEWLTKTQDGKGITITIVGGGATGVELAGTLAEMRNLALPSSYPEIDTSRIQVRLVEMAPELLAPFTEKLRGYAYRQIEARQVDVRLSTQISEVRQDSIVLGDGEELASDITVWAAGVSGQAEVATWGLPQGKGGRIEVGPDLLVRGQDRILAIGDIALITEQPLPQLAAPAIQLGRHAADQLQRLEAGRPLVPFKYHDKGIMATIGRRSAVVQLAIGIKMRGWLAWLAWLGLHIFMLLGGRNRITALVNLSWRYLTWTRGGGMIVGDDPAPAGSSPVQASGPEQPG
jgi:NADH dehydrogenase